MGNYTPASPACTNTPGADAHEKAARRRQAAIADHAERLEQQHGRLYLSVVTPFDNSGAGLRRARAAWLRRRIAAAGLWTVETGEKFGGLHLNIISTRPAPATLPGAALHVELINSSARAVAAYISKPQGRPPATQYDGRLFGQFGVVGEWLITDGMPAIVQGAALNDVIVTPEIRPPSSAPTRCYYPPEVALPETPEHFRALAEKHLSALYAIVGQARGRNV